MPRDRAFPHAGGCRARPSSIAFQSGEIIAIFSSHAGSCEIGKNAPEKRKIGSTPMRMINGNATSLSCATEKAHRGAENAAAHSPAIGIARIPHADGIAPST